MVEIRYCEFVSEGSAAVVLFGKEVLDGVSEALIPRLINQAPVFFTKRFDGIANHLWKVMSVSLSSSSTDLLVYEIFLQSVDISSVEYLYQTLKSQRTLTAFRTLYQGTLVEVDYGFPLDVGRSDGQIKTNKRYSDTVLTSEMHKRRLAVVVKVISSNLVQVAPVTSRAPHEDNSVFTLSPETTARLPRYASSGHDCYVLCGRLQAVSTQRILPPLSFERRSRKTGRFTTYPVRLSKSDLRSLKAAMLHGIGVTDYVPERVLLGAEATLVSHQQRIEELEDMLSEAEHRKRLTSGLCQDLCVKADLDYEEELQFWADLQAENGSL